MNVDYNQEFLESKEVLDSEATSNRFGFVNSFLSPGDSVLDVGCSNGNLKRNVKEKIDYFGIDISKTAIEDNPYDCMVADAQSFNLDKQFDKVVCLEVLEHLKEPLKAVECLVKHVKRGGLLLITVPKDGLLPHYSHLFEFSLQNWKDICGKYTPNYTIMPLKKYDFDNEKNLFSVRMRL